jgi:uncharacterized repeat protein (TIGR02543 family)
MRRIVTLFVTLVLAMSGLALSPAHAAVPSDGTYLCTSGEASEASPNFTITNGTVVRGSSCAGTVVIPPGVTQIGWYAFDSATSLTSITIPASVITIGSWAFQGATSLVTVTFEAGSQLATIEEIAFSGATSLISITLPASVTTLSTGSFYGATALTSITVDAANPNYSSTDGVLFSKDSSRLIIYPAGKSGAPYTIPSGVTSIGDYSFQGATSLTSISIPPTVTFIGIRAFKGATSLTRISIPPSVTSIGRKAFQNATALTGLTVDAANPNYSSADGVLFSKDSSILIAYPAGKTGTSFTIPSSVTGIEDMAFQDATSLTSVTIPSSVTSIGEWTFLDATSLTSVYFLGNAPRAYTSFDGVASEAKVYIKSGATGFGIVGSYWEQLLVSLGFFIVTYNTTGGSLIADQEYAANFPAPTSPTRTDYTFAGWSANAGGSVIAWPNTPALGIDITLYAKWTRNLVQAVATVKPTVSGTAKVSKTLIANQGTWTGYPNPAFAYQWYACSKTVTTAQATFPSTCKKITGATKSTLKLMKAQKGKFITVLVTGNGIGTSATKWLSKSTAKVK